MYHSILRPFMSLIRPRRFTKLYFDVLGSKETITCYTGLTVTDASTGAELFNHQEEQICKVHNFCQTVTLSSTNAETGRRSKLTKHILFRAHLVFN